MKIGIFGGTFNPIHTGHAIIANYIAQNTDLDEIWFMVAPQNPLKDCHENGASDADRIHMAKLVAKRLDKVKASDFEFSLPRPSFTYNTLCELSKAHPGYEFHLIIGADNWQVFNKWRNHEKILNEYSVMVYPRMGYNVEIPDTYSNSVKLVNAPIIELSSTNIRSALRNSQNMSFFLAEDVYQYILDNKLYL